jgi:hypothetical protein
MIWKENAVQTYLDAGISIALWQHWDSEEENKKWQI